jgi:hypothetical protein
VKWLAIVVLSGCIGRATARNPHEGEVRLQFHNVTGGPICELYVFSFGQTNEGANRIAADTELPTGKRVDLWLAPNTYQLRAAGCPYESTQIGGYAASAPLPMNGLAVIYREDDAASKSAAEALVHAHENSTLIPAKLGFVKSPPKKPPTVKPVPGSR